MRYKMVVLVLGYALYIMAYLDHAFNQLKNAKPFLAFLRNFSP